MAGLKSLAKQTAIYGVSSIVGRFLNYLLVPLYTYTFPPEQYGIVTEYYAYVVVLQILMTYGMETGFFRFAKKENQPNLVLSTVLISIIVSSLIFLLLITSFSSSISSSLGYSTNIYVNLFAFILAIDAITAILFAKLRAENKAMKFATFKIINILTNIFFNVFFIIICPFLVKKGVNLSAIYNPVFGVGYIFLANLFASIISLLLFIPDFKSIKFKFDFKLFKRILIYSLPLLLTGLAGSINEMADRILIKRLTIVPADVADKGAYLLYQLGIYGANAKLAIFMMLFVQAFRYASEPFFFSYTQDTPERNKLFSDVMRYYILFSFVFFLLIMLNLRIFKYFIGSSYYEGLNIVFPLFLSRILLGTFFILSFWYKLYDVTYKSIYIYIIGVSVVLLYNFYFLPRQGYIAAAWANFFTYLAMSFFSYIWSTKYMKVNYNWKKLSIYVLIPIVLYFISKQFPIKNLILSLLFNNGMLLFYLILIFRMEKLSIKSILNRIKSLIKK